MKTSLLLLLLATGIAYSCTSEREVEVRMVNVQLVRIDTLTRYPNSQEKVLTWRSDDNIDYVTYEPMRVNYIIGSRMAVMVR